jgi:anaerobic selenocysteine-containing dehydrogenase
MSSTASVPTRSVPPSVSNTPLPLSARDLPTVCVLCSHNCGLRVDVEDGRIAAVRADDDHPVTHGYLCNKAFAVPHYAHHAQRLEHPLRRRADGSFERIGWDEAMQEIGGKLRALLDEHGPRSIGLVGVGGQANHMDAPYALSWLEAVGSKRWFNAFAQEKHQHFLIDQWMFDAAPSVFFHPDQANAKLLLVMGTNPRISNRGHNANDYFKAFGEDPGRRLVVVDPRETETTRAADRHVRAAPGTDVWFLLAVAASIVSSEGLVDAGFVAERTADFEALREALSGVDVEVMSRRCGVPVDEIQAVASELATADSAAIMWDLASPRWRPRRIAAPSASRSPSAPSPRGSSRLRRSAAFRCSRPLSCPRRCCSITPSGCAPWWWRVPIRCSPTRTPRVGARPASDSTCSWSSSRP